MDKPDTLSLIDFIAERYGIELREADAARSKNARRQLEGPHYRDKLRLLKQMHGFAEAEEG